MHVLLDEKSEKALNCIGLICECRHMTNVEGGSMQMHRSATSRDVTEYSTGAAPNSINMNREEDIEYQAWALQHSSGFINVSIAKPRRRGSETDEDTFDLDISANGSYSLDLV